MPLWVVATLPSEGTSLQVEDFYLKVVLAFYGLLYRFYCITNMRQYSAKSTLLHKKQCLASVHV
jgi:hypothetical protein